MHASRRSTAPGPSARRRARATSTSSASRRRRRSTPTTGRRSSASVAPYVEGDFSLLDDTLHIVPGGALRAVRDVGQQDRCPRPAASPNIGFTHEDTPSSSRASRCATRSRPRVAGEGGVRRLPPGAAARGSVGGLRHADARRSPRAQHYLAGAALPAHRDA